MNDSQDFQNAESIRSGNSHINSRPASFPPHPILGGVLSRSSGVPSRREGPPSIWDTHGISGNVDCKSRCVFISTLSPKSWIHGVPEQNSRFTHQRWRRIENQTPVQYQRCQSGQSDKSSVIPSEGDSFKNDGADQQRLQNSDLHFEKFTTPATFAYWKIRFKTEVRICSQFPSEAM